MQASNQGSYVILPRFNRAALYPVAHFKALERVFPVPRNNPFFSTGTWLLTENSVRKHLAEVLAQCGLDRSLFSFHSFGRSGATLAYNLQVNMAHIKRHGTWRSDTVDRYIVNNPQVASGVANTFQNFINGSVELT